MPNSQNYSNTKWPRLVEVTSRWLPGTQWKYWLCASWQSFCLLVTYTVLPLFLWPYVETAALNQLLAKHWIEWISWNLAKGINPVKHATSLAEVMVGDLPSILLFLKVMQYIRQQTISFNRKPTSKTLLIFSNRLQYIHPTGWAIFWNLLHQYLSSTNQPTNPRPMSRFSHPPKISSSGNLNLATSRWAVSPLILSPRNDWRPNGGGEICFCDNLAGKMVNHNLLNV